MRCSTRHLVAVAVVATAAIGSIAGVVDAKPTGPDVPSTIDAPAGNKPFLVGHAEGVQIYTCNTTASGFEWTFVAPRAVLYGDNGKRLTTHFAGPTWQARDGSAVVARRVDGVTVDATAIPWLLLSSVSTTAGTDGDRLTATTFVQRTHTTGGLAPAAAGCNATTAGTAAEVPYTADYWFWKATGS
jgi:hypothetical protein